MLGRITRAALGGALLLLISSAPALAAGTEVFSIVPAFSPFNAAGRSATIKGVGFTPTTTVDFDGTPAANVIYINSRTLVAVIPVMPSAVISTVTVTDPVSGTSDFFPFLHTGPVIYVSNSGSDANPGTSPASPKLTLGAAMAAVDEVTPTEIRVEGGYYLESQLELLNATALSCGWETGFVIRNPEGAVTEINGGMTGFVIRTSGLENKSVIDGCTIANGLRDGFGGGGLAISADSTIVNNNVIAGNLSTTMGGGIYWRASTSYGGTPNFSNNVLVGNRAANKNGGAIGIYQSYNTTKPVKVTVTNNHIVGNRSKNGRGGGFSFNTGTYQGYNNATLRVYDNTIMHNTSKAGGGIHLNLTSFADYIEISMMNNLLAANVVTGSGGGVLFNGLGTLAGEFAQATVADNSAGAFQGGGYVIGGAVSLDPAFSSSDLILWNNTGDDALGLAINATDYSLSGTVLGGTGNLSTDPLFTTGQFHPYYLAQNDPNAATSPAVDAGSGLASDLSLDPITTATDNSGDAGVNDMGFHSLLAIPDSPNPIAVTRVDPQWGDLNGNDWVLVRGDGFDPGAEVRFDNVPAADTMFLGNTRILARPAPHPEGFVNVRVFNPDSSNDTLISGYIFLDNRPPTWVSTVGIISATGGIDACERAVQLEWNPAVDQDSGPVIYEVYREECIVSLIPGIPCDNFGYIPNATNIIGTTTQTFFVDNTMSGTGQAKDWVYNVRARDSANFFTNKEWNYGKRVATGIQGSVEVPPEEIGDTLRWVPGDVDSWMWQGATGATRYGFYRTDIPSEYSTLPSLPLLITLDNVNNDGDADGLTDTTYTDPANPALGDAFYYKISAVDNCGGETTSEILSP